MNKEKEDTKDSLNQTVQDFERFRRTASDETNRLTQKTRQLQGTIDTQKTQLNELRPDKFETPQGEVRYVVAGGNVDTINLGSADELRPGITFGVIDADETRLPDAKVKATIQVTKSKDLISPRPVWSPVPRFATRSFPATRSISPFWAPGRDVKIALAGEIDIDGDKSRTTRQSRARSERPERLSRPRSRRPAPSPVNSIRAFASWSSEKTRKSPEIRARKAMPRSSP